MSPIYRYEWTPAIRLENGNMNRGYVQLFIVYNEQQPGSAVTIFIDQGKVKAMKLLSGCTLVQFVLTSPTSQFAYSHFAYMFHFAYKCVSFRLHMGMT